MRTRRSCPLLLCLLLASLLVGCERETHRPAVAAGPEPAENPVTDTPAAALEAAPQSVPTVEPAVADVLSQLDIPYTMAVLPNGLTVVVHEDHKAPLVAVNVWYHVGSKNEHPGITGFAHLFEHLMFNGTEHYDDDYFRPFEEVGATDMNGTTSQDRTNYFQTVPETALDLALWMESDRMGHLLGAIDQGKLDEQRDVVKNEKRQREGVPYGKVWELIVEHTYPEGHPYSWTTIGSMEDLDEADLDDVRRWFETYYGAANAVLVIAGDVDTEQALEKARRYFGEIDAGPPVTHPQRNPAPMLGDRRARHEDRVAQARLYQIWNLPAWGERETLYLQLAAEVLGGGKTSRLYRRLVEEEGLATDISASVSTGELGSQLFIVASARPEVSLGQIEPVIEEELEALLAHGPTTDELDRVKTSMRADLVRGLQKVGGFSGKAQILARSTVYAGSPDAWRRNLATALQADSTQVREAAQAWLQRGRFTLEVVPFPSYQTASSEIDRSALPAVGAPPALEFPPLTRTTLANGLEVVLAERRGAPLVEFRLLTEAGYAADKPGTAGIASLAMEMLEEGTESRNSQQIAREQEELGAEIGVGSGLDKSTVALSALTDQLEPSLALYADIIRNPAFPERELARLRQQRLAEIAQEKTEPTAIAMRVLPPLLYGEGHAYAQPLTGTGYEAVVREVDREQLAQFYRRWVRPDTAQLVVVGDISMDRLEPLLAESLGDWQAPAETAPAKQLAEPPAAERPRVYLIDRPGYEQSLIFAGLLTPPTGGSEDIPLKTANMLFGGMFSSRVNMNLREDKGWTYGARSMLPDALGQRPWMLYAPVQRDKTAESIREMLAEIAALRGDRPITAEELAKAQKNMTLKLPGSNETMSQLAGSIGKIVTYELPDTHYENFVEEVRGLAPAAVQQSAEARIDASRLVWVIVGDLGVVREEVESLDLGPIEVIPAQQG